MKKLSRIEHALRNVAVVDMITIPNRFVMLCTELEPMYESKQLAFMRDVENKLVSLSCVNSTPQ